MSDRELLKAQIKRQQGIIWWILFRVGEHQEKSKLVRLAVRLADERATLAKLQERLNKMMSDIVEELNESLAWGRHGVLGRKAAAEITALRERVRELEAEKASLNSLSEASMFCAMCGHDLACSCCDARKALEGK